MSDVGEPRIDSAGHKDAADRASQAARAGVRSAAHATFHLTRTYPASAAQVWKALTDPDAKAPMWTKQDPDLGHRAVNTRATVALLPQRSSLAR